MAVAFEFRSAIEFRGKSVLEIGDYETHAATGRLTLSMQMRQLDRLCSVVRRQAMKQALRRRFLRSMKPLFSSAFNQARVALSPVFAYLP